MSVRLPEDVERILGAALVCELTVRDGDRPVSYPLLPLFDGRRIFMTSSILFSRKLEHIKIDPKVAVSVTDPDATPIEDFVRVTVQGDARVIEDDLHAGWLSILPLWEAKEPVIRKFVRQRFGLPLFFERSIIEITPRRAIVWRGESSLAQVIELDPPAA